MLQQPGDVLDKPVFELAAAIPAAFLSYQVGVLTWTCFPPLLATRTAAGGKAMLGKANRGRWSAVSEASGGGGSGGLGRDKGLAAGQKAEGSRRLGGIAEAEMW